MTDHPPAIGGAPDRTDLRVVEVRGVAALFGDLIAADREAARAVHALRTDRPVITEANVATLEQLLVGVAYPAQVVQQRLSEVDDALYRAALRLFLDPANRFGLSNP